MVHRYRGRSATESVSLYFSVHACGLAECLDEASEGSIVFRCSLFGLTLLVYNFLDGPRVLADTLSVPMLVVLVST